MPRPRKRRCCRRYQADRVYKPQGVPMRGMATSLISLDQFEALRLCDYEGLEQSEAGERMGISRGTVQRLVYSGRKEILDALLNGHAIVVNLKEEGTNHAGLHAHQRKRRSQRRDL